MLCRKKLSPARRRIRRYTAVFLAISVLVMTYFELAVKSQLKGVILRDMHTMSEQAVTMAVNDCLREDPDMGKKLSDIVYSGGSVAAVTTDSAYINAVKTAVTEKAQAYIDELSHTRGVSARLGSFTGIVFLANVGPTVHFSVDSTQTVSCAFESSFEGAGMNQTIHHITMTVSVELLVCNPYHIAETVSTASTFEIAQTVIVGAVPTLGGIATY